jgi:ABC-type lipoprotein release transport system permease subunit
VTLAQANADLARIARWIEGEHRATNQGVLRLRRLPRLAGAVMFEVRPTDPAIIGVVIATLASTGFAACIVPALRATKSDPIRSLRAE